MEEIDKNTKTSWCADWKEYYERNGYNLQEKKRRDNAEENVIDLTTNQVRYIKTGAME